MLAPPPHAVFGHAPSPLSILGAALICGSTLSLMLWEARHGAGAAKRAASSRSLEAESGDGDGSSPAAGAEEQRRLLQPLEQEGPAAAAEQELVERGQGRELHRHPPTPLLPGQQLGKLGGRQEPAAAGQQWWGAREQFLGGRPRRRAVS